MTVLHDRAPSHAHLLRSPAAFRLITVGGFAAFVTVALAIASRVGAIWALSGLALIGAFWLESSLTVCRRCRFFGTWHCGGQGYIVSRLFGARPPGVSTRRVWLHALIGAAVVVYVTFWVWRFPALGIAFTLWLPLAIYAATPSDDFSWRRAAVR